MKSYHDLQEQTYQSVREKPFQRMVGKKTWRKWCALRDEAVKLAVPFKVSYEWSQNKGLMALIYGQQRMAEEFPDFPRTNNQSNPQTYQTTQQKLTKMNVEISGPPWTYGGAITPSYKVS